MDDERRRYLEKQFGIVGPTGGPAKREVTPGRSGWIALAAILVLLLLYNGLMRDDPGAVSAIRAVRAAMASSGFVLAATRNPAGEGWIVYVANPGGAFNGARGPLWLVAAGQAFALDATAKELTPALALAREARAKEIFDGAGDPDPGELVDRFYPR